MTICLSMLQVYRPDKEGMGLRKFGKAFLLFQFLSVVLKFNELKEAGAEASGSGSLSMGAEEEVFI